MGVYKCPGIKNRKDSVLVEKCEPLRLTNFVMVIEVVAKENMYKSNYISNIESEISKEKIRYILESPEMVRIKDVYWMK